MQFEQSIRNVRKSLLHGARVTHTEVKVLKGEDLNLQMYIDPPTEDISIVEFEELAVARLKVLRMLEDAKERCSRNSDELNDVLAKELKKLMPIACGMCPADKQAEERRRDLISHFILRLAFCKTPEQTKWFIQQELDLFRYRFQLELKNRSAIQRFLNANCFNMAVASAEEKDELSEQLSNANCISVQKARCIEFWKVPFTDALELVRRRKTFLRQGFAYISLEDLVVIVCTRLRLIISKAMARACKYIGFIEEEDRLMPLLNKLTSRAYIGKDYNGKGGTKRITLDMIDALAAKSFPLCMRHIHHRLRVEHHVRHGARMQYGLFLKGIGVTLDDALAFWRAEFTKKMDSDKFDKQYAYNIRHNYGKEGRRADYPAYPCSKIILGSAPAAQDCHGCPYRHCDPQVLAQRLEGSSLTKDQVQRIVDLAKNSQYDRACTRYFEITHKMAENSLGTTITHPNQYFELSRQIHDGTRSRESEATQEIVLATQNEHTQNQPMEEDDDEYLCSLNVDSSVNFSTFPSSVRH